MTKRSKIIAWNFVVFFIFNLGTRRDLDVLFWFYSDSVKLFETFYHYINYDFNILPPGTAYGAGVYFSPHASLSVQFCSQDSGGSKHIFSVQVLTGDMCQGRVGLKVLPTKPGKGHMTYDSAADNPSNPSEIVIFHDSQAYPTYHIVFK